jgi:hypothetical protein
MDELEKCDWKLLPKPVPWTPTPPHLKPIQRMWKSEPAENLYPGRGIWKDKGDLIGVVADANDYVVNKAWDATVTPVGKALKPLLRFVPMVVTFVLLFWVFHLHLIVAILLSLGITVCDLLRAVGLIGPKRRDKNGKEIDDPF